MGNELILNENHEYWRNGIRIPGVTEILEDTGIKRKLPAFTYTRGIRLHKVNELFFTGKLKPTALNEEEMEMIKWIGGELAFYDLEVIATEIKLYSDIYNYAGRIDNIAKRKVRQYYVIDLKTSHKMCEWHKIQLSAYAKLANSNVEYETIIGGIIFYERKKMAIFLTPDDLKEGFEIFKAALTVYNFKRK